ncbi:hypothetical protein A2154_03800 [Candidatus Gottesmanbacteria bacterium RBG_16_43_7]|uniref:Uncharacterized protein n=1 Tax=Candidatus Gottesmanbacteria bacterium RBG_16_43_7 TaxID=1798373 RepID=A0A1F5Z9D7_9BACT|nr:MAG: hypothetical protein A2154_03800 [Candidatus Gottesmanbacteria bacterium RBG_16_43_7]
MGEAGLDTVTATRLLTGTGSPDYLPAGNFLVQQTVFDSLIRGSTSVFPLNFISDSQNIYRVLSMYVRRFTQLDPEDKSPFIDGNMESEIWTALGRSAQLYYDKGAIRTVGEKITKRLEETPLLREYLQDVWGTDEYVSLSGKLKAGSARAQAKGKYISGVPTYEKYKADREKQAQQAAFTDMIDISKLSAGDLAATFERVIAVRGLTTAPYSKQLAYFLDFPVIPDRALTRDEKVTISFIQNYIKLLTVWESALRQSREQKDMTYKAQLNQKLAKWIDASFDNKNTQARIAVLEDTARALAAKNIELGSEFLTALSGAKVHAGLMAFLRNNGYEIYGPDVDNPEEIRRWDVLSKADLVAVEDDKENNVTWIYIIDAKREDEFEMERDYRETLDRVIVINNSTIHSATEMDAITQTEKELKAEIGARGKIAVRRCIIYVPLIAMDNLGRIAQVESQEEILLRLKILRYKTYEMSLYLS